MLGNSVFKKNLAVAVAEAIAALAKEQKIVALSRKQNMDAAKGGGEEAHRAFLQESKAHEKLIRSKLDYMLKLARTVKKHRLMTCNSACAFVIDYLIRNKINIPAIQLFFGNYDHTLIILGANKELRKPHLLDAKNYSEDFQNMVVIDLWNLEQPVCSAAEFEKTVGALFKKHQDLQHQEPRDPLLAVGCALRLQNPVAAAVDIEAGQKFWQRERSDVRWGSIVLVLFSAIFANKVRNQPSFFSTQKDFLNTAFTLVLLLVLLYFGKKSRDLQANPPVTLEEDTLPVPPRKTM